MLLVVIVLVLVLGRTWCAWLCPFGLAQEGITKLRTLLNIPPLRLSWKTRTILRRIKYAFMFFTVMLLPVLFGGVETGYRLQPLSFHDPNSAFRIA